MNFGSHARNDFQFFKYDPTLFISQLLGYIASNGKGMTLNDKLRRAWKESVMFGIEVTFHHWLRRTDEKPNVALMHHIRFVPDSKPRPGRHLSCGIL
jgi:hypothetical protein